LYCTELVSTGWAPVTPGVAAAMASAWLPNGRAPLPAARCLADVDADVELADRLADDGGYRLAEREKGDREPGRDSYLGDHRGSACATKRASRPRNPVPHRRRYTAGT